MEKVPFHVRITQSFKGENQPLLFVLLIALRTLTYDMYWTQWAQMLDCLPICTCTIHTICLVLCCFSALFFFLFLFGTGGIFKISYGVLLLWQCEHATETYTVSTPLLLVKERMNINKYFLSWLFLLRLWLLLVDLCWRCQQMTGDCRIYII